MKPKAPTGRSGAESLTVSTWLGFGTGNGRNRRASARLNMAEFAPMPSASESTATVVKPGVFRNIRNAYWMSDSKAPSFERAEYATRMPAVQARQAIKLASGWDRALSETGIERALLCNTRN